MGQIEASGQAVVDFLGSIRRLTEPPRLLPGVLASLRDPEHWGQAVTAELAKDSRFLEAAVRLANSASYAPPVPVTDGGGVVAVLGKDTVTRLAIADSLKGLLQADEFDGAFRNLFWKHSLAAASGARVLMERLRADDAVAAELAFAGGLLHDVGKIALRLHAPAAYQEVAEQVGREPAGELEAERDAFGFDHAALGRALAEQWGLPGEICLAIGFHHQPLTLEDHLSLVDVLHVADALSYHLLAEDVGELSAPAMEPGVLDRSGLRIEEVGGYMEALRGRYQQDQATLAALSGDS